MKYSKKQYILCITGLFLLMLAAFFGPQFVFKQQDNRLISRIWKEERNSLEIDNLAYNHEQSVRERMLRFAGKLAEGAEYQAYGTEYTITREIWELGIRTKEQPFVEVLQTLGFVPDFDYRNAKLVECRKYILYTDDLRNGADFLLWYLKYELSEGCFMELLMDMDTQTIYCLQLTGSPDLMEIFQYTSVGNSEYYSYAMSRHYSAYANGVFTMVAAGRVGEELEQYFYDYYGADDIEGENSPNVISRLNSDSVEWNLPYHEYTIAFELKAETDSENLWRIAIGIRQLREWIPEMMQF